MTNNYKQEVINYLNKTSKHTFVKPNLFNIETEGSTYFKVFPDGDNFKVLESSYIYGKRNGYKLTTINVDNYVASYGPNAKCVIKHILFLGKEMKSVKNTKYVKAEIDKCLEPSLVK